MTKEFEKFLCIRKGLQPVTITGHVKAVERIARKGVLSKELIDDYVFALYSLAGILPKK